MYMYQWSLLGCFCSPFASNRLRPVDTALGLIWSGLAVALFVWSYAVSYALAMGSFDNKDPLVCFRENCFRKAWENDDMGEFLCHVCFHQGGQ